MSVKLYNTLTRQKESFQPLEPGKVKMYVCGPTVYNYIHIGNARPVIFFDVVRRYLTYLGYEVTYVQNFTDVDDKLIRRAEEEGVTVKEVADKYIDAFYDDIKALEIDRATIYPRVMDHMEEIKSFIVELIKKGYAYEADGDVYYRTAMFDGYGKLSHQDIDELRSGARIQVDERKENPLDFALWKKAKEGEIFWDSPWGQGRPGWHIECSAMSRKYLGDTIDIHAGGADIMFPHHENEIAQSEACNEATFARYWMHNGYVNIDNQKMSKSLGNFITVLDIRQQYRPEVLRLFMLGTHYRQPINFSREIVEQAENGLSRLENSLLNIKHRLETAQEGPAEESAIQKLMELREQFKKKMDDDFNTADAVSVLYDLAKEANLLLQSPVLYKDTLIAFIDMFHELGDVLGILRSAEEENQLDAEVNRLIAERTRARKEKNWARADEIRDKLTEMGIVLEDTPQGIRWKRK